MKRFKQGQTVKWTSQAGGNELTKKGTIIAVCTEPGITIPKKTAIKILRDVDKDLTVKAAERRALYGSTAHVLAEKYRLKFDWYGYREDVHYLVEVDRGEGRKPHLYHPRTETLQAV
jgi:hypothetical protein